MGCSQPDFVLQHELTSCAKDVISGTLHCAVEVGAEIPKFMVPGLVPHLEAGQLGQHNYAVKMTSTDESPH